MGKIGTQTNEYVLFLLGFHAFGDNEDVIFVRVSDDMAEEALVARIRVDSANVFHVDLDVVRREIDHAGEVRIIRSEIVDGDLAAERFKFMGDSDHEFALGRVDSFEDFEDDPRRADSGLQKGILNEIHEREVGNVVRGEVDGKFGIRMGEVGESLFDHYAGDGPEMPALFRGGEEFSRSDDRNGVGRIEHTDETLHFLLRRSERGVVVDFLIERHEEVFFEGVFHEGYHFEPFAEKGAGKERRIEKHGRFATFAGLVERDVRAHEHFLAVGSVGYDSHGKRKRNPRVLVIDFELVQMRKELGDGFRRGLIGADDGEIGAFQLVSLPALAAEQSR